MISGPAMAVWIKTPFQTPTDPNINKPMQNKNNTTMKKNTIWPHTSPKQQQHQETNPNKHPQNNRIPPPLRPNLPNQRIHARNLTRRRDNPPINIRQCLALQPKILINRIRLAQHPVHHRMALVDMAPFLEHVIGLGGARVGGTVGIDVGADVGE